MILAVLMGVTAAMLITAPWTGGGFYADPLANVATGLAIGLFWTAWFLGVQGAVPPAVALTCALLLLLGQVAALREAREVSAAREASTTP
jgi:hypothetical protein